MGEKTKRRNDIEIENGQCDSQFGFNLFFDKNEIENEIKIENDQCDSGFTGRENLSLDASDHLHTCPVSADIFCVFHKAIYLSRHLPARHRQSCSNRLQCCCSVEEIRETKTSHSADSSVEINFT